MHGTPRSYGYKLVHGYRKLLLASMDIYIATTTRVVYVLCITFSNHTPYELVLCIEYAYEQHTQYELVNSMHITRMFYE